jgi:hypothetical protein
MIPGTANKKGFHVEIVRTSFGLLTTALAALGFAGVFIGYFPLRFNATVGGLQVVLVRLGTFVILVLMTSWFIVGIQTLRNKIPRTLATRAAFIQVLFIAVLALSWILPGKMMQELSAISLQLIHGWWAGVFLLYTVGLTAYVRTSEPR